MEHPEQNFLTRKAQASELDKRAALEAVLALALEVGTT